VLSQIQRGERRSGDKIAWLPVISECARLSSQASKNSWGEAGMIAVSLKSYGICAWTPGIHSREQVEGWRLVTDAVRAAGGRIFLQLWHVGRISHPALQPDGMLPVAPSAIRPAGQAFIENDRGEGELVPFVTPRALDIVEMPYIVQQYERGARNALAAGFDGVEIHSANGYLLDQFINSLTNSRTDA
jgi:N-ethylmaleimide reductase